MNILDQRCVFFQVILLSWRPDSFSRKKKKKIHRLKKLKTDNEKWLYDGVIFVDIRVTMARSKNITMI